MEGANVASFNGEMEVNEAYMAYLVLKGYIGGAKPSDESAQANVGNQTNDAYIDPQYKLFSEKLREDGHAYVVEVEAQTGLKDPLRYETKSVPSPEIKMEAAESIMEPPPINANVVVQADGWIVGMDGRVMWMW